MTPEPPSPPTDPLFARVATAFRAPPPTNHDWVGTIIVFGIIAATASGVRGLVALVTVMILADLARFGAMTVLESVDARLLLLPFLARGRRPVTASATREALVVLVRPVFFAATAFFGALATPFWGDAARDLVIATLSVGLFASAPIKPYDGWRLLNLTLFSRAIWLETTVAALSAIALLALAAATKSFILAIVAAATLFGAFATRRQRLAAEQARATQLDFTPAPELLDETAVRALYDATMSVEGEALGARLNRDPAQAVAFAAATMREVQLHAVREPPPVGVTLALVASYGAVVLALLVEGIVWFALHRPPPA